MSDFVWTVVMLLGSILCFLVGRLSGKRKWSKHYAEGATNQYNTDCEILGMQPAEARRILDALDDSLMQVDTLRLVKEGADKAHKLHLMLSDNDLEGRLREREGKANKGAIEAIANGVASAPRTYSCGTTFRSRLKNIGDASYETVWKPLPLAAKAHNTSTEQAATLSLGGELPGASAKVADVGTTARRIEEGHNVTDGGTIGQTAGNASPFRDEQKCGGNIGAVPAKREE